MLDVSGRLNRSRWSLLRLSKSHGYLHLAAVLSILLVHSAIVARSCVTNFPVVDEFAHLPAGVAHLKNRDFSFYRVNPPLSRLVAAIPIALFGSSEVIYETRYQNYCNAVRPEFEVGYELLNKYKVHFYKEFIASRIACIIFSFFGAVVLYVWTTSIAGKFAGLISLVLWSLSPNIISNSSVVGPDMAATSMGLLASFTTWRWSVKQTFPYALLSGLSLGLAMLSKSSWIVGILVFPLLFIVTVVCGSRFGKTQIGFQLLVFFSSAVFLVNAGYFFSGCLVRLDSFEFLSSALKGDGLHRNESGNRFVGTLLGAMPALLPRDYVLGIDYLKWEVEGKMISFLAGKSRMGGWWYYYIVAVMLKTPLGTLALTALVLPVIADSRSKQSVWYLVIPSLAFFIAVSAAGGFNHHHRYILPVYPLLFMLAACNFGVKSGRLFLTRHCCTLALFCTISASLVGLRYPHTFFNSLAGGPFLGYRWLSYSNVEWGQDLLRVNDWISEHSKNGLISVALAYPVSPESFFEKRVINESALAQLLRNPEFQEEITGDGLYLILHSTLLSDYPTAEHSRLVQNRQPVQWIAASYQVFEFRGEGDLAHLIDVYRPAQ